MATNNKGNELTTIVDETTISRKAQKESFPVNWTDWDFIKRRITQCEVNLDIWGYATSFFFSITIFAFTMWASLESNWHTEFLAVTIASFLLATVCFFARWSLKHKQTESIKTVLEYMALIELRYQRPMVDNEQKENE